MKIEISNFKLISVIADWDISCEISLMLLSVDLTDVKSILFQVMADGPKPLPEPLLTQIFTATLGH